MANSSFRGLVQCMTSSSLLAISLMANSASSIAQTENGASPAGPLEEIVVTAQKREESMQDVPVSIQAMSGGQLRQMGIDDTSDLPMAIPGFQISASSQNQLYYLRGVGSQQVGVGRPAVVATIVDGVYMPFPSSAMQGFNNISSIEVDKGPQGTLFGRNSTGGVIQINTFDPKHELGGDFSIGYGNYDHFVGKGYLTFGVSDGVAGSFSILADRQGNGYGRNTATGEDSYRTSIYSGQTKWLFDLSDTAELRIAGTYADVRSDVGSALSPAEGVQIWNQVTKSQQYLGRYQTSQNAPTRHRTKSFAASAQLSIDLDWAQARSISAYQGYDTTNQIDFDVAPEDFLAIKLNVQERVFTQELQLSSSDDSAIVWTAGAFYLNQNGGPRPFRYSPPFATVALPFGVPLGDTYQLRARVNIESMAAYGQATIELLPRTRLTLGLRYTYDKIHIAGFGEIVGPSTPVPTVVPSTVGAQKSSTKEPTYRIVLDHDFNDDLKVYASYNRGFQSGGFNSSNARGYTQASNPALSPEFIDAYEIGLKSELFGRTLRFNLAGFYYDYRNLQQQTYIGGALQTLNAGAAKIRGIDAELVYSPNRNFTIGVIGEVLDAKFTQFDNAPGFTYSGGTYGLGPLTPVPIPDASGNYLGFAPKLTGTIYASHTLETGVGKFRTGINLSYNDGYYVEASNLYRQPSFTLVNVSEEWEANENISIRAWVKNLFDERYDQSVAAVGTVGFVANAPGAPREYGVTARYRF